MSEDKQKDFEERSKVFVEKYGELTKEINIDIASFPTYVPDGQGGFKTVIQQSTVDTSEHAYRSAFVAEDGKAKEAE